MLRIIALVFTIALCRAAPRDPEEMYGSYNLIYSWPKINEYRPNCTQIVYSKSVLETPVSCSCRGVESPLQLFHLRLLDLKFDVVSTVIDSVDQLKETVSEECSCTPADRYRDVLVMMNDDYLLHYVSMDKMVFLLSKVVPTTEEAQEMISAVPRLAEVEGDLLCYKN